MKIHTYWLAVGATIPISLIVVWTLLDNACADAGAHAQISACWYGWIGAFSGYFATVVAGAAGVAAFRTYQSTVEQLEVLKKQAALDREDHANAFFARASAEKTALNIIASIFTEYKREYEIYFSNSIDLGSYPEVADPTAFAKRLNKFLIDWETLPPTAGFDKKSFNARNDFFKTCQEIIIYADKIEHGEIDDGMDIEVKKTFELTQTSLEKLQIYFQGIVKITESRFTS